MSQPQNITFDVPNAFELEKLSELHKAMGDFTRTKILWQLMQGEQCVNDLAKTLCFQNMQESFYLYFYFHMPFYIVLQYYVCEVSFFFLL